MERFKLLFVDDSGSFFRFIQNLIGNVFEMQWCSMAETAMLEYDISSYDLLITDYKLPGVNGLEFCEYVRKEKIDTPIIVVSGGWVDDQFIRKGILKEIYVFEKSIEPDELFQLICALFKDKIEIANDELDLTNNDNFKLRFID